MHKNQTLSKPENAEQPSGEGLSSSALFSSLFHPGDSDRGFLMWIHERLEHVHGENHLMDYMHKLRAIIADLPADRKTVSVGQGKNSLEALQESILENDPVEAPPPVTPEPEKDAAGGCPPTTCSPNMFVLASSIYRALFRPKPSHWIRVDREVEFPRGCVPPVRLVGRLAVRRVLLPGQGHLGRVVWRVGRLVWMTKESYEADKRMFPSPSVSKAIFRWCLGQSLVDTMPSMSSSVSGTTPDSLLHVSGFWTDCVDGRKNHRPKRSSNVAGALEPSSHTVSDMPFVRSFGFMENVVSWRTLRSRTETGSASPMRINRPINPKTQLQGGSLLRAPSCSAS